jgi:hypothetical protein
LGFSISFSIIAFDRRGWKTRERKKRKRIKQIRYKYVGFVVGGLM